MKLVIKELLRKTETVVQTWEKEFKSMEDCLLYLTVLDRHFSKELVKFEYIIKE